MFSVTDYTANLTWA
jgi:hypothetical protein